LYPGKLASTESTDMGANGRLAILSIPKTARNRLTSGADILVMKADIALYLNFQCKFFLTSTY